MLSEAPWAAIPQPQYEMVICHHCFNTMTQEKGPRQCHRCKTVYWCSAACARAAEAEHDRGECAMLQQHPPDRRSGLHGLRMFARLATAPQSTRDAMATHRPRTAAEAADKATTAMAKGIISTLPSSSSSASLSSSSSSSSSSSAGAGGGGPRSSKPVSVAEMATLITNVHNNSFFITDLEGRRLASAYYGAAALLNHSCSPNAIAGFSNGAIEIRTTKTVPKGAELLISYTELYRPSAVRKADLLSKKKFECRCDRCVADEAAVAAETISAYACSSARCPGHAAAAAAAGAQSLDCDLCETVWPGSIQSMKQLAAEVAHAQEAAGTLLGQGNWAGCAALLEKALAKSKGKLHTMHWTRFECHVMLAEALVQIKPVPFDKLSTHARIALHCMEQVYGRPAINPRAASMALILGDCWMARQPLTAGALKRAETSYENAASILETAWGGAHVATVDAQRRRRKAAAGAAALQAASAAARV